MSTRRIAIVGAGGTGIPLAARLRAAGHDVVLLEAGTGPDHADAALTAALENAWTVRAGLPGAAVAVAYDTELLPGRAWRIGRGRMLGGSTAVNGAYFQRPHPDDFAAWEAAGGPAWGYAACLPALRRLESDRDFGVDAVHGVDGPVPVQRWGAEDPLTQSFLAAAQQAGARAEPDKNAGGASGVGLLPRNALGPQRWGVARAYAPLLAGVEVRTGALVERIRFRSGRAVGVELAGCGVVDADEVILCGGAIETPRLLMASGIGDPERLRVAVQAPLPGVGRGLSDHAALAIPWSAREGSAPPHPDAAWSAAWNHPGSDGDGAFELLFAVASSAAILSGEHAAPGELELRVSLARPRSRGEVLAPGDGPDVRYGYLTDARDRATLRDAVRAASALLHTGPLADAVAAARIPEWTARADADDEADAWIRANVGTALHSCGTARMGPATDALSVVDAHGRVHGVPGLRVADAAILPVVPSRGTALTAVMLGERIAELMAQE